MAVVVLLLLLLVLLILGLFGRIVQLLRLTLAVVAGTIQLLLLSTIKEKEWREGWVLLYDPKVVTAIAPQVALG
jgi:hypothetical protein